MMVLSTVVLAFAFSTGARLLAEAFLTSRIAIFGSWVGLALVENQGVAFGVVLPPTVQELLIASVLLLFIVLAYRHRSSALHALGFGLIIGGALANIVDRINDGLVTDFFQVGSFPVFNIADSCITLGAALLLWKEWMKKGI